MQKDIYDQDSTSVPTDSPIVPFSSIPCYRFHECVLMLMSPKGRKAKQFVIVQTYIVLFVVLKRACSSFILASISWAACNCASDCCTTALGAFLT